MFYVVKLKDVLELDSFPKLSEKLSNFSSINEDITNFIKDKAVDFDKRDLSRTYFILDTATKEIAAYFSLTLKVLNFNAAVSNNVKKRIQGATSNIQSVPVILIGQLGKNFNYSGTIKGSYVLDCAMDIVNQVYCMVGCRVCLIETLSNPNNEKVVNFYENYGFKKLANDTADEYYQMYKRIKD